MVRGAVLLEPNVAVIASSMRTAQHIWRYALSTSVNVVRNRSKIVRLSYSDQILEIDWHDFQTLFRSKSVKYKVEHQIVYKTAVKKTSSDLIENHTHKRQDIFNVNLSFNLHFYCLQFYFSALEELKPIKNGEFQDTKVVIDTVKYEQPPEKNWILRRLYFLNWLKAYDRETAIADLIAGVTLGLTIIPQSIAYAALAGLSSEYGLYSAIVGKCVLYTTIQSYIFIKTF